MQGSSENLPIGERTGDDFEIQVLLAWLSEMEEYAHLLDAGLIVLRELCLNRMNINEVNRNNSRWALGGQPDTPRKGCKSCGVMTKTARAADRHIAAGAAFAANLYMRKIFGLASTTFSCPSSGRSHVAPFSPRVPRSSFGPLKCHCIRPACRSLYNARNGIRLH